MKRMLGLFIILILTSCIKNIELTQDDAQIVVTETDLYQQPFQIKPLKNGKDYFFSKTLNHFGYYQFYAITLLTEKGHPIKIKSKANQFYSKNDIQKLFKNDALIKKIYQDSSQKIPLQQYDLDDGFLINNQDYFHLTIIKDKRLYSLIIEGEHSLTLSKVLPILIAKLDHLKTSNPVKNHNL